MLPHSSILYQNPSATVFLLDIPASIALAQQLSPLTQSGTHASTLPEKHKKRRYILSSPPLEIPYPPSSEPKTDAARAKVLARIPRSERDFAERVEPLLFKALNEIQDCYQHGPEWCLSRHLLQNTDGQQGATAVAGRYGKRRREETTSAQDDEYPFSTGHLDIQTTDPSLGAGHPPLILSPGLNRFKYKGELCNLLVKNTSLESATVATDSFYSSDGSGLMGHGAGNGNAKPQLRGHTCTVPPLSSFLLCNLAIATPSNTKRNLERPAPIPGLPSDKKFNLILLDPPWSNKSVRRSGHYQMQSYSDSDMLTKSICNILRVHSHIYPHTPSHLSPSPSGPDTNTNQVSEQSIAAIWITNSAKARNTAYESLTGAGFTVCEEWLWVKTTTDGHPVTPIEGLWRKPYEVLVIGKKQPLAEVSAEGVQTRVIVAVPDVHSRKPNLREVFERIFFSGSSTAQGQCGVQYSALEVFARNLTAGWWACGNEVLKFNSEEWWVNG
ncbi:MT-A70-domain-containing protein [Aspergillus californicus]